MNDALTSVAAIFSATVFRRSPVVCHNGDNMNVTVTIEGQGLSHADLNETVTQELSVCQISNFFNGTRHRVLSTTFQSEPHGDHKIASDMYRATAYDAELSL